MSLPPEKPGPLEYDEPVDRIEFDFGLNRRSFVQWLGAGLLIVVAPKPSLAQRGGGRNNPPQPIATRLHIGKDGIITVFTGKVECGQGARAELTQAAAEELRVPLAQVRMVMADTSQVPNDGITAGSRSTPSTVPAIRQAAAAAREVFTDFVAQQWGAERAAISIRDGKASQDTRTLGYGDLASNEDALKRLQQTVPADVTLTPLKEWKSLGTSAPRPNGRDVVTGAHQFPSDIRRPGMLYGKVLRPPAFGARLIAIDLEPAKALKEVVVVRDEQFVGVAAPTTWQAEKALELLARSARWEKTSHPASRNVFSHLKQHAEGGVPASAFTEELAQAKTRLRESYQVAYVQHAPMEPRAAVAEWTDGQLTVWTATQNPFGCRNELMRAFHLTEANTRVIVPDFGGGFGGKHTGETGIEAARLARAAGKPVSLRWTREEEFTWAYFRPAAAIEIEASLDAQGQISSWHFININSGDSGVQTPYRIARRENRHVRSNPPLRHGSYRALASTANNFARECFMDELAVSAKVDPLEFRLAHLDPSQPANARLRAVLESAAERFDWSNRVKKKTADVGIGLACGTEKGSFVAACVEIAIDRKQNRIIVRRICEVFECGPILNPANLRMQVEGAIIQGLGPALTEEVRFEDGEIRTASFRSYPVPRFDDVPEMDIHLLDRPDLAPAGGGETPIIAVAPAIGNAVFQATGIRVRMMPIRLPA